MCLCECTLDLLSLSPQQIGASDAGSDTQRRILIDSTQTMTGTFSDVSVSGQWQDAKGRCYTYWVAKQEQQQNSLSGMCLCVDVCLRVCVLCVQCCVCRMCVYACICVCVYVWSVQCVGSV